MSSQCPVCGWRMSGSDSGAFLLAWGLPLCQHRDTCRLPGTEIALQPKMIIDKAKPVIAIVGWTAFAASVAGCSKDAAESSTTSATEREPAVQVAQVASTAVPVPPPDTADPIPDFPTAKIAAPPSRYGTPQRGIIRDRSSFQGEEVARLDNGTTVRILERKPGGWLKIRWDSDGGAAEGWVHTDVVKE
ncbi:MAG TPA: SH3 domain-containing protein [Polyangiaceae bacterium]|nr:MAG: hypothetical protein BWY17_03416 [Deltaproteobacteria bacterium ADurb.Bin207]HNS98686.1 SH3 domain-containing protein [Polyangiaceae bacterium]HNZ24924.1 SH3 domain-containing protein [Polyangiaceae bacterium]HOD24636.1 SH3 domain-containing protein [Polyangiaceae bacterium]HOE50487.1 SH3 domain-containing protein [Polyangiaceae bacterium]